MVVLYLHSASTHSSNYHYRNSRWTKLKTKETLLILRAMNNCPPHTHNTLRVKKRLPISAQGLPSLTLKLSVKWVVPFHLFETMVSPKFHHIPSRRRFNKPYPCPFTSPDRHAFPLMESWLVFTILHLVFLSTQSFQFSSKQLIILQQAIKVTPDQCIAHLKLLEAFYQLREDIGNTENLFGISSPVLGEKTSQNKPQANGQDAHALAEIRVREKRWAVYVARAVDRFAQWWDTCVPATLEGAPCAKLTGADICSKTGIEFTPGFARPIVQLGSKDQLPPIDVIMVWHSYLLNPRNFFEDCLRYGMLE